jgi:hypothetical protein
MQKYVIVEKEGFGGLIADRARALVETISAWKEKEHEAWSAWKEKEHEAWSAWKEKEQGGQEE